MPFDALSFSPITAPLEAGDTFSLSYPSGREAIDYESTGHYALVFGGRYALTPTFGATIDVTWAHETVPVGGSIALQFELIAGPASLSEAARRDLSNVDPEDILVSFDLDQVDNTRDANKPVSAATQTALDLKADAAATTAALAAKQASSTVLTFLATASAATAAAVKTLLALVKGDVGLGDVDNTSDASKPVSSATLTALNLKADISYVDALLQGLDPKASVKAATTANITLSAAQTIDGVSLVAGDRCLVKDQSTASQNGIYVVAAGAWTRATDMDAWTEVPGAYLFVEQGTANADTAWVCSSNTGGTIGSTSITWQAFGAAVADAAITNAKLANMAQATIKGRASGAGTGAPTDLSAAQVKTILGYGTAADQAVGTSGATVGLLSTANDYSAKQTLTGGLSLGAATGVNIASGAVAKPANCSNLLIDTEGAAGTDDLDTISGGVTGDLLLIRPADTNRDVVVTTAGNIAPGPGSFTLSSTDRGLLLFYAGAKWIAIGKAFDS